MRTVLLLGGPHDGHVLEAREDRPMVILATAGLPAWATDGDPTPEQASTRKIPTTVYVFRSMVLFGRKITVGVPDNVGQPELDRLAIQHLLTPVARNLLDGAP